jgi:uncharacterized protein (DUF2141 family)
MTFSGPALVHVIGKLRPPPAGLHAYLCRWALVVSLTSGFGAAWSADLEVEVRGARPRAGDVHVAVFDRAEAFALDTEIRAAVSPSGEISAGVFAREEDFRQPPADWRSVTPTTRTLRLTFSDLQPGDYAVAAYQDLNGNNKLDATIARHPTEPWGISNNARPNDRPVTWDEAKFTLPPEGAKIVIELRQ